MLKVNVATRPFYNERGVQLLLGLVGLLLLGLTAYNASAFMRLSSREAQLASRTSAGESRARELRAEAGRLKASIRQDELDLVVAAAREANGLIEQRTFSWTRLFNHIEGTLPGDVMLTAVHPAIEDDELQVTLTVVGREVAGIDTFMQRLEETRAFRDVLSRDERALEDGGYEATLVGIYEPQTPGRNPGAEGAADARGAGQ